jgi:hypothetical protein
LLGSRGRSPKSSGRARLVRPTRAPIGLNRRRRREEPQGVERRPSFRTGYGDAAIQEPPLRPFISGSLPPVQKPGSRDDDTSHQSLADSSECRPIRKSGRTALLRIKGIDIFSDKTALCIICFPSAGSRAASVMLRGEVGNALGRCRRKLTRRGIFFIFIAGNPLKSPDSKK